MTATPAGAGAARSLERTINDFTRLDARGMKVVSRTQHSVELTIAREMPRVRRMLAESGAGPRGKACA